MKINDKHRILSRAVLASEINFTKKSYCNLAELAKSHTLKLDLEAQYGLPTSFSSSVSKTITGEEANKKEAGSKG